MLIIITVNGDIIKRGFRWVKAQFSMDADQAAQVAPFGDDSCPPKGIKGIKSLTDNSSVPVVLGYFNKSIKSAAGEKRFYSVKPNGDEAFYIWLKNDGTCEVGGADDNLVRYSALETAFNELKGKYNDLASKFNTHTHGGVMPGGSLTAVPVAQSTQSSANITPAKISQVKTYKTEQQ